MSWAICQSPKRCVLISHHQMSSSNVSSKIPSSQKTKRSESRNKNKGSNQPHWLCLAAVQQRLQPPGVPTLTGSYNPLTSPKQPGLFHCSHGVFSTSFGSIYIKRVIDCSKYMYNIFPLTYQVYICLVVTYYLPHLYMSSKISMMFGHIQKDAFACSGITTFFSLK